MSKILATAKIKCNSHLEEIKILVNETNLELTAFKEQHPITTYSEVFNASRLNLRLCSLYVAMSNISFTYLDIKNETYLLEARRAIINTLLYLESIYSGYIDAPYSDYEDKLHLVLGVNEFDRYELIKQAGFFCDYLSSFFNESNKWYWSFVELKGRIAAVFKNSFELKGLIGQLDPRVAHFKERTIAVNLSQQLLKRAATDYRTKYELSSYDFVDFQKAIEFLSSAKRFYLLLNRSRGVEELQKQIDAWKAKLDSDQQKAENA